MSGAMRSASGAICALLASAAFTSTAKADNPAEPDCDRVCLVDLADD